MPWIRRTLRGNRVFVRTDADGQPQPDSGGRVEIVYNLRPDAKVYRANLKNLESTGKADDDLPIDGPEIESASATSEDQPPKTSPTSSSRSDDAARGDEIHIYTDGACTGNPGPMGIGAVILDGENRHELSEYIGVGTNNIAELTAILRAVESMNEEQRRRRTLIHSDSSYSIGLLSQGWKAKANKELVANIREKLRHLDDLRFVKVKGHAGIPENERCDELARLAIDESRRSDDS